MTDLVLLPFFEDMLNLFIATLKLSIKVTLLRRRTMAHCCYKGRVKAFSFTFTRLSQRSLLLHGRRTKTFIQICRQLLE